MTVHSTGSSSIYLSGDSYTLTKQIYLTKEQNGIILKGNRKTVVKDDNKWSTASNGGDASILEIVGASNITVEGIEFNNAPKIGNYSGHGINIYQSSNITLKNVKCTDNAGSGVTINDSTVTINGITTAENKWQGINIDDKKSPEDSSLTLSGAVNIGEALQVTSDNGNPKVTWNNSKKYELPIDDKTKKIWTNREYGSIVMKSDKSVKYEKDLRKAVTEEASVVLVFGTNTLDSQLVIKKPIAMIGTEDAVIKAGEEFSGNTNPEKNLVSIENVKSATISNLTISNSKRSALSIFESGHSEGCTTNCTCTEKNGIIVDNVVLKDNPDGNGMLVNGSVVKATNIKASNNGWKQSIDVTQGDTKLPSVLYINNVDTLDDVDKIVADEKCNNSNVEENDGNHTLDSKVKIKVFIGNKEISAKEKTHVKDGLCKFIWSLN